MISVHLAMFCRYYLDVGVGFAGASLGFCLFYGFLIQYIVGPPLIRGQFSFVLLLLRVSIISL